MRFELQSILSTKKEVLLLTTLILTVILFFPNYIWIAIAGLIIFFVTMVAGEKFLIFLAIVSFLTLTSTISVALRTMVQVFNVILLFYLFIKKYGLNLSAYPKIPKQIILLLSFVVISMLIATLFSNYMIIGIEQIVRTAIFFIIVYFIYSLIENQNDIRLVLYALAVVAIIYVVTLFMGFAKNNFDLVQMNIDKVAKVSNDYLNMNALGSFFVIVIPIALSYFLDLKKGKTKSFLLFFLILTLFGLMISNSRAAILAVTIESVFLLYNLNKKFLKIFLILGVLLIPILFINPFAEYIDLYFRFKKLSTGRDVIWSVISNIIKDNFLLGVGPAATKYFLFPHSDYLIASHQAHFLLFHYNEIEFGHAHNFYLFFWSDLGILGLFTSLLLPYTYLKMGLSTIKENKNINRDHYLLTLGLVAAGMGLFIRAFFEWGNLISYGTLGTDLPFWLVFIILIYLFIHKGENSKILLNN